MNAPCAIILGPAKPQLIGKEPTGLNTCGGAAQVWSKSDIRNPKGTNRRREIATSRGRGHTAIGRDQARGVAPRNPQYSHRWVGAAPPAWPPKKEATVSFFPPPPTAPAAIFWRQRRVPRICGLAFLAEFPRAPPHHAPTTGAFVSVLGFPPWYSPLALETIGRRCMRSCRARRGTPEAEWGIIRAIPLHCAQQQEQPPLPHVHHARVIPVH